MKILHIIPDVNGGGASKGAFRIHRAVQSQGVNSQLLVLKKNGAYSVIESKSITIDELVNELDV